MLSGGGGVNKLMHLNKRIFVKTYLKQLSYNFTFSVILVTRVTHTGRDWKDDQKLC